MSKPLKVGDRVRVLVASDESGYRYGDRGTVHRVEETPHGTRYHVAMDEAGGTGTTVIFAAICGNIARHPTRPPRRPR